MAGHKRTTIQRERDLVTVAALYLKGYGQQYIADEVSKDYDEFSLTRQQIGYDIKKLIERWRRSQLVDVDDAKTSELEKINHLERTYWDAWERSCEDAETKRLEGILTPGTDGGKTTKQVVTRKGQAGDPRFLTGVQWCIERRCKIIGIDAPLKQEHGGIGGGPIQIEDVNETRQRLLESIQRSVARDDAQPEDGVG